MVFLAITIIYGVVISSYYIYQNQKSLAAQREAYYLQSARQMVSFIDQGIASLDKYVDTLFLDDYFSEYLMTDQNYYVITKVYDKLNLDMSVFSKMGARVAVSKMEDDLVISNTSTRDLALFYDEMGIDGSGQKKIEEFYLTQGNQNELLLLYANDYKTVHIIKKRRFRNKDYLILLLSVDGEAMNRMDDQFHLSFVPDDRSDEDGLLANRLRSDGRMFELTREGFHYVQASTVYPEIEYLLIGSYQEVPMDYSFYGMLILLTVAVLGVGLFVASALARSTYKPIDRVMGQFNDQDNIADEFEFLSTMTEDILEANKDMERVIVTHRMDLKTKFLREVLLDLYKDIDQSILSDYQWDFMSDFCRVVLIEMKSDDRENNGFMTETLYSIRKNVKTIIEKTIQLEGREYALVEVNDHQFALVVKGIDDEALKILLGILLKAVRALDDINIIFSYGSIVQSVEQLHKSFNEARQIMDERPYYDRRAILSKASSDKRVLSEMFVFPIDWEKELYVNVIHGNTSSVIANLDRVRQVNHIEKQLSSGEVHMLFDSLLMSLKRMVIKMNQESYYPDQEVIKAFRFLKSFDEKFHWIKEKFIQLSDLAAQTETNQKYEMNQLMIQYIQNNYNQDISLEECAAHLNISAGYFCTTFKKLTGTNFKTYLNQYRVEEAKKIIKENPLIKIKDLTFMLGYNNVNSFIRMFKKSEGISPGEYAKQFIGR